MALLTSVGAVVNSASGVAVFLLGVWVLSLRPRGRANVALALMCLGFGAQWALDYLVEWRDPLRVEPWYELYLVVTISLGAAGAVLMALTAPKPLARGERPLALAAAAVAFVGLVALVAEAVGWWAGGGPSGLATPQSPLARELLKVDAVAFSVANAVLGPIVILFALRHGWSGASARVRAQFRLLALAFLLLGGVWGGRMLAESEPPTTGFVVVGSIMLSAVVWLVGGARLERADRKGARDMGLLCLALPLVGLVGASFAPDEWRWVPEGVAQLLAVLVLAYAILRHQLLGLDVKVRWTLEKSTIAAVFVVVFFVVSEGAQVMFSGRYGPVLGIAAAGALVFAIHPLQRVAERVAASAVPMAPSAAPIARREGSYRFALRKALRDSVLTKDEERALAHLAADLGIDAGRAFELREAVDAEMERRR